MSRRATSARRVTESTNRPARKRQENKLALSALAPRAFPDTPRECGVPTPPCSALRLLSSPAHSRACPFAVARATQVYRRKRNQPGINKRASPSRGRTTRPLRASPRHPRLSLRRRRMSSCGAETHLLFTGAVTPAKNATCHRERPFVPASRKKNRPLKKTRTGLRPKQSGHSTGHPGHGTGHLDHKSGRLGHRSGHPHSHRHQPQPRQAAAHEADEQHRIFVGKAS